MGYFSENLRVAVRGSLLLGFALSGARAEPYGVLTGRVVDSSNRAAPGATILVRNLATLVERSVTTNNQGLYEIPALPAGVYRVQVTAPGFRPFTVEALTTEVARTAVQNVRLELGDVSQEITVKSKLPLIDGVTTSVGHVIDDRTVQEIPLNGRYFLDLALLAPGSVTAPQNTFSAAPFRGLGAFAIITAGNREETVNFMINGITLNDSLFNSITFQPSISAVQEFKIDNSTISAEYGQNSGAVVNVSTRSGSSEYHGELFEFLRNDALDARNFFTLTSTHPPPFKRSQFGANFGGPIFKGRTFFFFSYEGLRQSQKVDLNSLVLSDAERQSASDAVIARLIKLIPRANFIDSAGTPRFISSAHAPVDGDQWGVDISRILNKNDRLHAYYSIYRTTTIEPGGRGTTIPGFGYLQQSLRQFFSLNETHTFGHRVNDARVGLNRLSGATRPNAQLNPADFGIRNGITEAIGLPQISVAGGALNFGGPSNNPSGRGDLTFVAGDTLSCLCGRHSLKIGGEFRQMLNNNFRLGTGAFTFPSVADFLADAANSFSVTLGSQSSSIAQRALNFFIQSDYKWRPNFTLELGLRYEWNMTPEERYGRFIIFDPPSGSLERVGQKGRDIYHQNDKNFEPRVGFAWDPFKNGRTSVRGGYAILVEQPITNAVVGTAGNPPLANPLALTGSIRLDNAIDLAHVIGLAPASIGYGFSNAYLQSWNLNVQRELAPGLSMMAGYFGSKGTHLLLQRNINQPAGGVRPFPAVSLSSSILPGMPIGNIIQTESDGNSSYNALWVSANRPLASGLDVNVSYTWSKSLDYNSLSSMGVIENSYNLRADRGLSDFDARQRLVASVLYSLPFGGVRLLKGWQAAAIVTLQSGNPVNIVTTNSAVNGMANTLRPDVTGPIRSIGSVDRWFDTSVFTPVPAFGGLGRNVVIGPPFHNADVSISKNTELGDRMRLQFRAELFNALNHANLGQPGNVVGSPGFGRITGTRFATGELGSSRQVQAGIKLMF